MVWCSVVRVGLGWNRVGSDQVGSGWVEWAVWSWSGVLERGGICMSGEGAHLSDF